MSDQARLLNRIADPRNQPSYQLKSAFEEPQCRNTTTRPSMKPKTCDGKVCGPYDTRLCPQQGSTNQPRSQQGWTNQPRSQQGWTNQPRSQQKWANQPQYEDDCGQYEDQYATDLPESVCDESDPPNYWSGLCRAPGGSNLDEMRKNIWCKTPLTEYMATHGDLASKILTGQIPLKRDVLGEPPCNICEHVMPPCRGYCQEPECVDYCLDMTCVGPMQNRDKVSRYWNPCMISDCDNDTLAFPASGLIEKLRKRNA